MTRDLVEVVAFFIAIRRVLDVFAIFLQTNQFVLILALPILLVEGLLKQKGALFQQF